MRITRNHLTPLLVVGAAMVAIAAAPVAAANVLTCTDIGSATQCLSPGNTQITANTPPVQPLPSIVIIHRNGGNR